MCCDYRSQNPQSHASQPKPQHIKMIIQQVQARCIPGVQGRPHTWKSVRVTHRTNTMKNQTHVAISVGAEKTFHKTQHAFVMKNTKQVRTRRELLWLDKGCLWRIHSYCLTWWWKTVSPWGQKCGEDVCSSPSAWCCTGGSVLGSYIKGKGTKGIQAGRK